MKYPICFAIVATLLASGCGDDDDPLDPEGVTELPPGDAQGSAASGSWRFDAYTSSCAGVCAAEQDGFSISFCDVGDRDDGEAEATQQDGVFRIDVDESFWVSRLEGGIDHGGAFDVGGYGTEYGGQLEITARLTGTLDGDQMSGIAEIHLAGASDEAAVDCRASYEVEGERS